MTDFVKKTKLTELENKISDISSLATKAALTLQFSDTMTQKLLKLET